MQQNGNGAATDRIAVKEKANQIKTRRGVSPVLTGTQRCGRGHSTICSPMLHVSEMQQNEKGAATDRITVIGKADQLRTRRGVSLSSDGDIVLTGTQHRLRAHAACFINAAKLKWRRD